MRLKSRLLTKHRNSNQMYDTIKKKPGVNKRQVAMHAVTIEDRMSQWHFLRKLEAALDFSFMYEEAARLYS